MKGLLAGFDSEQALREALQRFASWREIETYTPMPLSPPGLVPAPRGASPAFTLPLAMFIAGIAGFSAFFWLMAFADVRAYPLDIGGRPNFAWPTFVPIAFELGVLCAMAAGFFGFFIVCRLPRLFDPIDQCASLKRASRDGWFLAIRSSDAAHLEQARGILVALRPASIEEFAA